MEGARVPLYLDWKFVQNEENQFVRFFFVWIDSIWQRMAELPEEQCFEFRSQSHDRGVYRGPL